MWKSAFLCQCDDNIDMSTIADIKDPSFVLANEANFHHPSEVSNANFLIKLFKNNFFEEIYIFRRITDILCYSFRFLFYQPTIKTIAIWNLYSKLILFLESPTNFSPSSQRFIPFTDQTVKINKIKDHGNNDTRIITHYTGAHCFANSSVRL